MRSATLCFLAALLLPWATACSAVKVASTTSKVAVGGARAGAAGAKAGAAVAKGAKAGGAVAKTAKAATVVKTTKAGSAATKGAKVVYTTRAAKGAAAFSAVHADDVVRVSLVDDAGRFAVAADDVRWVASKAYDGISGLTDGAEFAEYLSEVQFEQDRMPGEGADAKVRDAYLKKMGYSSHPLTSVDRINLRFYGQWYKTDEGPRLLVYDRSQGQMVFLIPR